MFFGDGSVQGITRDREPWFLVKDLGRLLKIKNIRQRMKFISPDEKGVCSVYSRGGKQRASVVNEAGLYRLIFDSRVPEAEKFKTWIVRDVLPAIRRTGKYEHRKREHGPVFQPKDMDFGQMLKITMRDNPGHVPLLEWPEQPVGAFEKQFEEKSRQES
jgi:prophage antirepressor-like protein